MDDETLNNVLFEHQKDISKSLLLLLCPAGKHTDEGEGQLLTHYMVNLIISMFEAQGFGYENESWCWWLNHLI